MSDHQSNRKKICFVVATPASAESFLKDHIKALSENYDIYLAGDFSNFKDFHLEGLAGTHHVAIARQIAIGQDLKAVKALTAYLKEMKFDAVHSVTPKAGLITALAGKLAGIPHRTHIFTGQVWATRTGNMRRLLKSIDKLIVALDNHILVDGEAQRQFLIKEHVVSDKKSKVLGAGSICGANTERFTPSEEERKKQRKELRIPEDAVVFSFMGRLNKDKGIYELLGAFNTLVPECPNAYLLIFGRDEEGCMNDLSGYLNIKDGVNFQYYGNTPTPELSLQASDVFCLPSYREGFGMSVVEASCLGIPVICSDAYGLGDTMVENETGLRCKVKDFESLKAAMKYFYEHPEERKRMGANGRKRVLELFPGEKIVGAWKEYYNSMLG